MGKDFLCAHDRVTFSEAFEERSRGVRKIKQKDYLEKGLHPVVDQGQSAIAGYSDEEDGLFADVPGIVFGDHTRCVKYIDEPFFAGADGVKILKPKLSDNTRFWYHALRATRVENLGYSRHFKLLKQSSFRVYEAAQERAISQQLDIILRQIEVAERQIESLDSLVKSQFVEMFGGEKRYSNLGSLILKGTKISYGIVQPGVEIDGGLGVLRPVDFDGGRIARKNIKTIDPAISKKYSRTILTGDELLIVVRGATGDVALSDESLKGMNVTRGIAVVRYDRNKISPNYLVGYLRSDEAQRYIADHTQGATLQQINMADLRAQPIKVPPIEKQNEFSDLMAQVDKSKSIARKQIEKLQLLYDSLAQEYFGD